VSPTEEDSATAPTLAKLQEIFRSDYGFLTVDQGATFGPQWTAECEETIRRLFGSSEALHRVADGYAHFVLSSMRLQKRFEKERAYPAKSYAEAADQVYQDEEYMTSQYLPGLLLSHFLWPHHYSQLRFFDTAFVSQMRFHGATEFVEVGIGTGLYSRRALEGVPTLRGTGYDISPGSVAFARAHIEAFGLQDRFQLLLQDIVAEPMAPTEWLVCMEVIEHLEDPVAFLRTLRAALEPEGRAFITTAINAASVDHIYLYENVDQIMDQLQEAGFSLQQGFIGAAYKPPAPGVPVPTVAAFVVE
jgi:2-polyprenyl-3-methyl-5-hydroxy-6-metoxy-1,4-benzoquinol methylase